MKKIITLLLFSFLLQSAQCSKDDKDSKESKITSNDLVVKKQEIIAYITSFNCESSCSYIALGSKPCGGPWEYLPYPNTINETVLTEMVVAYNQMEQAYNTQNNLVSDCAAVMPPNEVNCINGICKIIN